jgi:hypothetical protein
MFQGQVVAARWRPLPAAAAPGATSGQPTDSAWNAAFESKIETLRLRYHFPGLSAGVVYQGKLVWKKGFGYADVDRQVVRAAGRRTIVKWARPKRKANTPAISTALAKARFEKCRIFKQSNLTNRVHR